MDTSFSSCWPGAQHRGPGGICCGPLAKPGECGQTWWTHPNLRERNLPITEKIVCCWSSNKKSSEKPLPCYYPVSDLSCHDSLSCSSWLMSIYTCWQLSSGVFAFWRNGEADSWILINKYYFGIISLRYLLPIIWLCHQEPLIYVGSFPASTI